MHQLNQYVASNIIVFHVTFKIWGVSYTSTEILKEIPDFQYSMIFT